MTSEDVEHRIWSDPDLQRAQAKAQGCGTLCLMLAAIVALMGLAHFLGLG